MLQKKIKGKGERGKKKSFPTGNLNMKQKMGSHWQELTGIKSLMAGIVKASRGTRKIRGL